MNCYDTEYDVLRPQTFPPFWFGGVTSSIKGSGTLLIKMHDGMVRKLDCWYIPELWKNLISLGTLGKNVMRYAGEVVGSK